MSDQEKIEFAKYIAESLLNNLDNPANTPGQLQYKIPIVIGILKNLQRVLNGD